MTQSASGPTVPPQTRCFGCRATPETLGKAEKRPISAAVTGTGNSSVFRHADLSTGFSYLWRNAVSRGNSGQIALKSAAEFERFLKVTRWDHASLFLLFCRVWLRRRGRLGRNVSKIFERFRPVSSHVMMGGFDSHQILVPSVSAKMGLRTVCGMRALRCRTRPKTPKAFSSPRSTSRIRPSGPRLSNGLAAAMRLCGSASKTCSAPTANRMDHWTSWPPPWLRRELGEPIREQVGATIGPYKLMEQIGEGGFGLVFVAEQQQPDPPQGGAQDHQAGHGHPRRHRPLRGRAAGAGADGPSEHRPRARRRHHRQRPALLRDGTGPRHPDHRVLRPEPAHAARAARTLRPGLQRHPARPSEGDHPPRHQAVERAGHAARRPAGGEGDRLRRRQGPAPAADRHARSTRASPR